MIQAVEDMGKLDNTLIIYISGDNGSSAERPVGIRSARENAGAAPAVLKRCTWVHPILVAQMKFTERTSDDQLRQHVFLELRTDKKPEEVVRE